MVCDRCGSRRPRTGPCPECGAPPPGSSSMREWKDRAQTGRGPAQGGRGQPQRGSGRSDARNRRGGGDYQEVELGRALVPTHDALPMNVGAGLPAIPGLPTTDEEERAIGLRRPAYIPATGEKRKRRLSGFRVVSGVLSLLLVCIAACTGTAFLGKDKFAGILNGPFRVVRTPAAISYPGVPATPVATAGTASKYILNPTTARAVDNNFAPVDPTSHFTVGDPVYVVLQIRGVPKSTQHTVSVHWFLNNIDVQLPPNSLVSKQVIQDSNAYFGLQYPQPGVGVAKLYWDRPANDTSDGSQYLAWTIAFAVQPPVPTVTPTPKSATTPGTGTPGAGTPTAGG